MNIEVIGRKVNLKDSFKERVDKKLAKFSRLFHEDASATVTVTVEKDRQTVEVMIRADGKILGYVPGGMSKDMMKQIIEQTKESN